MTMPRFAMIIALAPVLLSLGCSQATLVGKWESDGKAKRAIELTADGKAIFTLEAGMDVTFEGKYRVSGNRVVVTDIQPSGGLELPDFAKSAIPEHLEATFSWKNDREIVLSGDRFLEGGYRRAE